MKLTYLGTAAAEGFPAVFCNCEYCNEARRLKGKNLRTRHQALINDDLLIDLPADTYHHFLQNDIEGDKIPNLLISHTHGDHFYPAELYMHGGCFAHRRRANLLRVWGGKAVETTYRHALGEDCEHLAFSRLIPFTPTAVGSYTVTPLPARHAEGTDALFFLIEEKGKRLLYAHDTGYFYDEVFDYFKEHALRFDAVSFDCTNVDIAISDKGSHMGIPNILRARERLEALGCIDEGTVQVINHFSHNANPLHHVLEERVKDLGLLVSYDGMVVEL